MQAHSPDLLWQYRTLLIIWGALLMSHVLFGFFVYMVKPEVIEHPFSQPIIGDNPIVLAVAAILSLNSLVVAVIRRSRYVKQAVTDQQPELVQTGLIVALALSESVSLWGVFLAFAFDYPYFFIFILVGFLSSLLHFPRRKDLEDASFKSTL